MSDHKQRVHERQDLQLKSAKLNASMLSRKFKRSEPSDIRHIFFSFFIVYRGRLLSYGVGYSFTV